MLKLRRLYMKYLQLVVLLIFSHALLSQLPKFCQDMVAIDSNLFAGKYEITNNDWRLYQYNIATKYGNNSQALLQTLPDSTVWQEDIHYCQPSETNYYRHPAFDNYPVVGVSYEMVEKYIVWRNEGLKDSLVKTGSTDRYIYRLPTKKEWEAMSISPIDEECLAKLKKKYNKTRKKHYYKASKIGFKNIEISGFNFKDEEDVSEITAPVNSFCSNALGLFNIRGNVAEMVYEKGIAKGGSWMHSVAESPIDKDFTYNEPTKWLGFRLVMVKK